jgi:hypothetical protein
MLVNISGLRKTEIVDCESSTIQEGLMVDVPCAKVKVYCTSVVPGVVGPFLLVGQLDAKWPMLLQQ